MLTFSTIIELEKEWWEPFFFLLGSDPQLGMIERGLEYKEDPKWDKDLVLLKEVIAAANQMTPRPKFFIVCGDLVDAFPGWENRQEQTQDLKSAFADLNKKIPLVCVCGNHDIGDQPTPETVDEFRRTYGDDYFSFTVSGVLMIVINSQYYESREFVEEIAQRQEDWIDSLLVESKGKYKHILVFQHIPWFQHDPEEPKNWNGNIRYKERMRMLNKFHDAGIRWIFCGHYHRNAGGRFKELELVITSAIGAQCGKDKSGARIVKVFESKIEHKYYAMEDLPNVISLDIDGIDKIEAID